MPAQQASPALVYPWEGGAFTCPRCGQRTNDQATRTDGWCRNCRQPSGLCGAGRDEYLTPPPGTYAPEWEAECPQLGPAWWLLHPFRREAAYGLLCHHHHRLALHAPWINGIPIELGDAATASAARSGVPVRG